MAQPALSRAEEASDPGDRVVSVRGIAEDKIDRERQHEQNSLAISGIRTTGTLEVLIDRIARSTPRE
jgi:hypothetical protein